MSRRTLKPVHDCVSRVHLPLFDLKRDAGRIYAKALLPPESIWFQGHFPGIPILPCVAVTALAVEPLLRCAEAGGRLLKIIGFTKVRIRMLTYPNEELSIAVEEMLTGDEAELSFDVSCRGEKVCQGRVLVAEQ